MKKEYTSFELTPQKLAELIEIGTDISETNGINQKQEKINLLYDRLAATLPEYSEHKIKQENLSKTVFQTLALQANKSIKDLLLCSKTDISVLKDIKKYNQKFAKSEKLEHDVAVVIYYASIANALLFHNQKITSHSYKNLAESFSKFIDETWIPENIVQLFIKAHKICQDKI